MAFRQILCCAVRLTVQTAGNAMFFRLRPEALSIRPEAHMSLSFKPFGDSGSSFIPNSTYCWAL